MQKNGLRSHWRGSALALVLVTAACGRGGPGDGDVDGEVAGGSSVRALGATPVATEASSTVTLITGDRVTIQTVDGKPAARVKKGLGRNDIGMEVVTRGKDIYVFPADIAELVGSGALDQQLFNVTQLLANGYGDDRQKETPLLLTGVSAGTTGTMGLSQLRGQLASAGVSVTRTLPSLGMVAVRQPKDHGAAALAQLVAPRGINGAFSAGSGVAGKIWLDGRQQLLLDRSVPQIGAPAAYARGLTGAGVKVAVIDSGVDANHPDLIGKVGASETFVDDGRGASDVFGHGTHVASIVAGSGAASGGQFHGVAPGATLLNARVCDEWGSCYWSDILAGMDWAAAQGAQIVNLSLGGTDNPGIDPIEQAVNELSATRGMLFVVAAGNSGQVESVSSPASAKAALAVGAVDVQDRLARFSSRGPGLAEQVMKPEIAAPGVAIVAARAEGTELGAPVGEHYVQLSGTSMATPHVAGAAALLRQQHPAWTNVELKAALMGAAKPADGLTAYQQGAGRVDLDRATSQQLRTEPASLGFGLASFPHEDDPVLSETVRYRNDGAQAVTLSLSAELRDLAGVPDAAGMMSISPSSVVVPAGGFADVVVTLQTRQAVPSAYSGTLIATSGDGARVITPVGVNVEVPSFDLKINVLGLDGNPGSFTISMYGYGEEGSPASKVDLFLRRVEGTITYHLPAGKYVLYGYSWVSDVFLVLPRITLDADKAVELDARLARPLQITLPEEGMELDEMVLELQDVTAQSGFHYMMTGGSWDTGQVGPNPPPGEIYTNHNVTYRKSGDGTAAHPEIEYRMGRLLPDSFPTGWQQSFRKRDFARVDATYQAGEGHVMSVSTAALPPADASVVTGWPPTMQGRFHRTEHYYGEGYLWFKSASEYVEEPEDPENSYWQASDAIRQYLPGAPIAEPWNRGPFGPGFYDRSLESQLPGYDGAPRRSGTRLRLEPTMLSGQGERQPITRSEWSSFSAQLLRNGQPFADAIPETFAIDTAIPAERARYRMEAKAERSPAVFDVSTRVEAAWSFDAQAGTDRLDLPLPTLRFSPQLDANNETASPLMLLPIHIARPVTAAKPRIADARVDVSFDDGATWRRLPIVRVGDRALGLVLHPRGATHVSLRGTARDVEGNEVEQTIVRAYGITAR